MKKEKFKLEYIGWLFLSLLASWISFPFLIRDAVKSKLKK